MDLVQGQPVRDGAGTCTETGGDQVFFRSADSSRSCFDPFPDLFQIRDQRPVIQKSESKFVPAVPGADPFIFHDLFQCLCQAVDGGVSFVVPVYVVDGFQPVHIHCEQRQGLPPRFGKRQPAVQLPQESAAVVEPCQVVVFRHTENCIVRFRQPAVADDRVERGGKEQGFLFKALLLAQVPGLHAGDEVSHGLFLVL